ncbi:ABC transporter permease subunit [Martelella alba]|uniref:ABC transporter permease subunit n=1 Tax=Martelella alba TaxID=2590451 RepID=A0A506UF99_9HYPH|nr:ABC transporter permease subunit [Martelella alba]TPW30477.1 ABC transporter permease subunit [Martelella alba]
MTKARQWLTGLVILIALWWAAGALHLARGMVPTPGAVVIRLFSDGWSFYGPNVSATLYEAALGYLWGNGLAILLALLVMMIPVLERLVVQLAVISYCVPLIAIGPILSLTLSGQQPMITLAALSVFFTTLVGALMGLKAADQAAIDVVRASGGGRFATLRYIRFQTALPALFAALALAAPAAFLGAVIGEWLGAVQEGLGIAMVVAMQQMLADRTFGIALLSGIIAGAVYALIRLAGHLLLPWDRSNAGGA